MAPISRSLFTLVFFILARTGMAAYVAPADSILAAVSDTVPSSWRELGIEINPEVQRWLQYYSKEEAGLFQRHLDRGAQYRTWIEPILRRHGLPIEIFYLAMVESGFQVHAESHSQAVGIWQFIEPTSHRYGLRVDRFVDERRDPIRSTEAAASYLKDLFTVFQSWHLALAAYNVGEARVLRAIMAGKTRDFWELSRKGLLPAETQAYVPKFIAAVMIGHHPQKYGFHAKDDHQKLISAVRLPGALRLRDISRLTSIQPQALEDLNPHLLRGVVPRGREAYALWVPTELASKVRAFRRKLLHESP